MANRNPMCDGIFSEGGVVCASAEDTRALGRSLAEATAGRATLSLEGPLGAGKTCFVQGLAEGLGIDPAGVSSPTFTLVHEYPGGRLPLVHFDLYRLDSAGELAAIGYEDYVLEPGICAIEWGDKFPEALPSGALRIRFSIEPYGRRIHCSPLP
jgi:tRNA threonylcarbamoyladenosine biosynthesis protein TsaE